MKHTSEEIISKGQFLARSKGYHDTSLSDILDECGITKGTFYNYFESKENYMLSVLDLYGKTILNLINEYARNEALQPATRLRAFYLYLADQNDIEECRYGCMLINFAEEVGGKMTTIQLRADYWYKRWLESITICIREGQEKDQIIDSQSAEDLAAFIHTAVNGTLARMKMKRSTEPMRSMVNTCLALITKN